MTEVTPENLDEVLEFDHVVRIGADGDVQDMLLTSTPIYAPEVWVRDEAEGGELVVEVSDLPWSFASGRTGQYGYNGSVMRPSEFVVESWAREILAEPGYYVTVPVYPETPAWDGEPIGWALAYLPLDYQKPAAEADQARAAETEGAA